MILSDCSLERRTWTTIRSMVLPKLSAASPDKEKVVFRRTDNLIQIPSQIFIHGLMDGLFICLSFLVRNGCIFAYDWTDFLTDTQHQSIVPKSNQLVAISLLASLLLLVSSIITSSINRMHLCRYIHHAVMVAKKRYW